MNMETRPLADIRTTGRDVMHVLAANPNSGVSKLRRELENAYDDAISDQAIYQNLRDLVDDGYVRKTKKEGSRGGGLLYVLTDDGREVLQAHRQWADKCLREMEA